MASDFPSLYQIETKLRQALHGPLPGPTAHLTLAPRPRFGWHPGEVPPSARAAAGLVLLYPHYDEPHLLLTVRAGKLALHAGQVSLPGGGLEPDESVEEAALREAAEEVGVAPGEVRVLGSLSVLYIPGSDFALHPIVGVAQTRPAFRAAAAEVGRMLEVPVSHLANGAGPRRGYRWRGRERFSVPYFEAGGERVWGATAMILAELLSVIGRPVRDPWSGPASNTPST